MENATKALLIAGGVLLAMLLIAVLIFAWGQFSEYYKNTQSLADIDDITNFNMQFTNYEDRDVYGYELISLANLVADYNFRYSSYSANPADANDRSAQNDKYYAPIKMTIKFNSVDELKNDLWYDDAAITHLFGQLYYEQSKTVNQIANIISNGETNVKLYGNNNNASRLAKSISTLLAAENGETVRIYAERYTSGDLNRAKEMLKNEAIAKYKSITGEELTYNDLLAKIAGNEGNIKQYYEYYQFKKAIFKCDINSITYDSISQRVNSISFTYNRMS